jgi:hypothetical protein
MSGLHFPSQGDFELEDAKFRGMQRGGRKRLFLHSVEDLLRQKKRHSYHFVSSILKTNST